jgi:hypothetical protein
VSERAKRDREVRDEEMSLTDLHTFHFLILVCHTKRIRRRSGSLHGSRDIGEEGVHRSFLGSEEVSTCLSGSVQVLLEFLKNFLCL